jgi:Spy/CpxP family protein refolding chaperone
MSHKQSSVAALVLVTAGVLAGLASPAAAQSFKWWQDERFRQELALVPEQVGRLDEIYQAASPTMRTQKAAVDRLQADLSAVVNEARADDATAAELIARVEEARADLGKTRAMMLYRMRRVITTDQHVKLKALFAERQRSRHGKDGARSRRQ